jgi:hypothetical protein
MGISAHNFGNYGITKLKELELHNNLLGCHLSKCVNLCKVLRRLAKIEHQLNGPFSKGLLKEVSSLQCEIKL